VTKNEALELGLALARKAAAIARRPVTFDDLLGPANLGVAQALNEWDECKPFEPLVRKLIRWRIQDYFREMDPLSRHQRGRVKRGDSCSPVHVEINDRINRKMSGRLSPPAAAKWSCPTCRRRTVMTKCPNCGYDPQIPTKREVEVWREISKGSRRKEVASALGIELQTVVIHRTNLARKLGVRGATAALLTRLWFERGMDLEKENVE